MEDCGGTSTLKKSTLAIYFSFPGTHPNTIGIFIQEESICDLPHIHHNRNVFEKRNVWA